ncbi:MAG TPA: ATP-binding protein [Thermoanaerobaculia bacterium]
MSSPSASVERTLRRAVLLPVVGAVVIGAVFLVVIQQLLTESERLRHTEEVIATAEQIRELAVDMETGMRGYLLTHDRRFLAPYERASTALPALLAHLDSLVVDNEQQRPRALTIRQHINDWQRFAVSNMRSADPVQGLMPGKTLMDRVRSDHDQFLQAERALSIQRAGRVRRATIAAVAAIVALAVLGGAILTMFIRRQLRAISIEYETALKAEEQLVLAKDRMLATVSHELRTPLTSILGWTTLLRSLGADAETTQLALASIEQSARLQSRLVEDLIDVSKAAAGKLRIDVSEIDLRDVLEASLETMRPAAEAKRVRLSTSIHVADLRMSGDAARLQQVFWNLLSNAVRFTPAGGKIDLSVSRDDGSVLVRVTDTGAGIEKEFLAHVFEPFAQENESGQSIAGLGLGLSIARRLVELHGGTISAASEGRGRGAEFAVRLPLSGSALQVYSTSS